MLRVITFCLLICLCSSAKQRKSDDDHENIITNQCANSAPIVEATVSVIEAACIFKDNKLFVRRLAYVESEDGLNPYPCTGLGDDTYHGGIWQVDEDMYDATKAAAGGTILSKYVSAINAEFQIEWSQTTWEDLKAPLHSALGAMLYYTLDSGDDEPPRNLEPANGEGQGIFWVDHYRPGQHQQHFVDLSNQLDKSCNSSKSDIVFVLDSSGSVSSSEFDDSLEFAVDVIEAFDVGADANQFAVIAFGHDVQIEIYLDTYHDKNQLIAAVRQIPYQSGSRTNTHDALEAMRTEVFSQQHGARGNRFPKVGILVTDGHSSNPSETERQAELCHEDGITMFAAGVGSGVDQNELEDIASPPVCTNIFSIEDYDEMQHLPDVIQKKTCDAPVTLTSENGTAAIGPEDPVQCTIPVPPGGTTVKLECVRELVTYYIAYATYPNEAYYDDKVETSPGFPGYLFVANTQGGSDDQTVFCSIVNHGTNSTICDYEQKPGPTPCSDIECTNGACVEEDDTWRCTDPCNDRGSCQCLCGDGFTGQYCETEITGEETYNCADNSPCTQENRDNGDFYFPHDDPSMYVQCGNHGECYEMPCPAGLVWDSEANTCNYPPTQASSQQITTADDQSYDCDHHNPCTVQNHLSKVFFHRHHNPFKFIQCSAHGDCFVASCPEGSKWNHITKNCNN